MRCKIYSQNIFICGFYKKLMKIKFLKGITWCEALLISYHKIFKK